MAGGRPTAFKPEYCEQATGMCRLGATNDELAAFFGVALSTLNKWKKEIPEFSDAIREGKEVSDLRVTESLYQKALNGDTTAMIFWLKNRQSKRWRDKINQEVSAPGGGPISVIERVIVEKDTNTNS